MVTDIVISLSECNGDRIATGIDDATVLLVLTAVGVLTLGVPDDVGDITLANLSSSARNTLSASTLLIDNGDNGVGDKGVVDGLDTLISNKGALRSRDDARRNGIWSADGDFVIPYVCAPLDGRGVDTATSKLSIPVGDVFNPNGTGDVDLPVGDSVATGATDTTIPFAGAAAMVVGTLPPLAAAN